MIGGLQNSLPLDFAGPPIMKEEVETAIKKMKHGKATGPDNISVELIEALEDFGIGKVTHLLNEIYDTGGRFQQIYPSLYSLHCQRSQVQQNVNYTEQSAS
ncbi:hypothetical protein PoB_001942600 [Plakobranchus ocellatus]|uniref:Reverse transcriptase domain-containing protein n=1 Tax=Plakobranchus ocellatus TaxID=259542 RepID=A0AAV3ZE63_9GAST|nr:hypothetical protein PoB_001942600 [Plakobranchus ocellatus]